MAAGSRDAPGQGLEAVLAALVAREPLFHRPEFGTKREDFDRMMEPEFWEVGASGRRYTRAYVLDSLEERFAEPHEDVWETRDFSCLEVARDSFLLTYTLIQGDRVTRRSSLWRRHGTDWKVLYHQGTLVVDPSDDD